MQVPRPALDAVTGAGAVQLVTDQLIIGGDVWVSKYACTAFDGVDPQ